MSIGWEAAMGSSRRSSPRFAPEDKLVQGSPAGAAK